MNSAKASGRRKRSGARRIARPAAVPPLEDGCPERGVAHRAAATAAHLGAHGRDGNDQGALPADAHLHRLAHRDRELRDLAPSLLELPRVEGRGSRPRRFGARRLRMGIRTPPSTAVAARRAARGARRQCVLAGAMREDRPRVRRAFTQGRHWAAASRLDSRSGQPAGAMSRRTAAKWQAAAPSTKACHAALW